MKLHLLSIPAALLLATTAGMESCPGSVEDDDTETPVDGDDDGSGTPDPLKSSPTPSTGEDRDDDGVPDDVDRCVLPAASSTPVLTIEGAAADAIHGCVHGVRSSGYQVVFYALTDHWYVQPLSADPYTEISQDGYWQNTTHPWDYMAAYIVVTGLEVPTTSAAYEPLEVDGDQILARAFYPSEPPHTTLDFAGYSWAIKNGNNMGPGPNSWSSENVQMDDAGLHLNIDEKDGRWYCPEVILDEPLGYGRYTFIIQGSIDQLDPQVIFSPFIYLDESHELDIEFSRWGDPANPENAQFVVQPYYLPSHMERFEFQLNEGLSTHTIDWSPEKVTFWSVEGDQPGEPETAFRSWTFDQSQAIPAPPGMKVHINLWLYQGLPPQNLQAVEVIVKDFSFVPQP